VLVSVGRHVIVPVRRTEILRLIVEAAAAQHATCGGTDIQIAFLVVDDLAVRGIWIREVLILTGVSVGIALPLSMALSSFVRSQLFGVSDRDPFTLLLVTLALAAVALLASWVPTHRATRVQPSTALRYE